jgi:putative membrane protein
VSDADALIEADKANGPPWERLPNAAVAAMYIAGAQKAVRENLFLFIGGGTGALVSDAFGLREIALVGGMLLLIGLLATLVYHRRFKFQIADEAIRVRKGLFEIKELKVRFERVQNVAFSQPLYLKPMGLTRVNLETPGASQTEVELPGIPNDEALALRERIAGAHRGTPKVEGERDGEGVELMQDDDAAVFAPGFGDLFRYGMTSNQAWIVFGVVGGPLIERVADRIGDAVDRLQEAGVIASGEMENAALIGALVIFGLVLSFIVVGLLISGLIAVVRFHGYRLTGDAERLRATYGLLDKREKSLKRTKVHSLELVQTALGRWLGRWHAVGHQAALDAMNPMNQDKRFLVPGIPNERLDDVTSELADRRWSPPEFKGIDSRFRRILWQRIVLLPLVLLLGLDLWLEDDPLVAPILLVLAAAIAATLVHFRWKRWGVYIGDDGLQVREGLIGTKIILFEDARCQQVKVTRSPYQRRHGLATLVIRLPHGEKTVPYLTEPLAAELANRLLHRIETSTAHAL